MIIEELKRRWWSRVLANNLERIEVKVEARGLSPEEAIGKPLRMDYPLFKGREVMIQAELCGVPGQAFTDEPCYYRGSIKDVQQMELRSNKDRALFVATANATYKYLGLISNTVHCKNNGPELCGKKIAEFLASFLPVRTRVLMIGFQPAIARHLSRIFKEFRVTDMDPSNIGQKKEDVCIESYENNAEAIEWSDVVLATGSTIVNGSIDEIVKLCEGKKLMFYGVTIASAAYEFGFERLCFMST
ncbi:MAG: DUF364 domain-containing protein [Candidatus Nezhaarchaeales archaeon]